MLSGQHTTRLTKGYQRLTAYGFELVDHELVGQSQNGHDVIDRPVGRLLG
jgi:hypothetical protein